ncbi:MAG: SDR family oxidoreductase, partial [Sphingobium sp.]
SKLGHCVPVVGDLSSTEGVSALAAEIAERCPELHVVVNNAGTGWYAPIDAFPEDRFDRVFDLNLKAPFFLVQKLLPALTRGASDANWSRVINLSSVGARQANAANAAYGASKAAVEHLTRIMARGLADRKIAVNGIAPGWFPSRLNAGITESQGPDWIARTPLGRFGTMQDMGGLALFLASPAGAFINGQTITIDGGVTL